MIIFTQTGELEKQITSVTELIETFDSITDKPFFINHIGNNISYWIQDNPNSINDDVVKAERLAFKLEERHNMDAWGTLYGPQSHIPQLDGTYNDNPQLKEITPSIIAYWEARCYQVKNPVIRLHYLGLVYSFKKIITNTECDASLLELYVKTIVDVSENEWQPSYMSAHRLHLALDIAQTLPHLIPIVKTEFHRLTSTAKNSHVVTWMTYFDYMLEHLTDKKIFDNHEKTSIVSSIETRLSSLMGQDPNAEGDSKLNPFNIKSAALKLAQYYKQTNDKANKERVIKSIEYAFRQILDQGNTMQQLLWLMEIQKCYVKFGMITEAQSLYSEIQSKGIEVKECLSRETYEITIPKGVIVALEKEILDGSIDEIYSHFVEKFTIKKNSAEEFVKRQTLNPLAGFMGIQILSESGMPLSKIGTPEYDPEGNEYSFGAKLIESEAPVIRYIVETLLGRQIFTKESLVNQIMSSGLINTDRRLTIENGVDFYFAGDYVTACHILIPQIEHAICNLALKLGANALRMQPSGNGYMVQLMDKLFDIPEIKDVLGLDKSFYLRTLLTEQRGMNLRNLLCHGLVNPMYFDVTKADRIIHALLLVGKLNLNKDSSEGK